MKELINTTTFSIQDWNFSLSAKKVKSEASISIRKGKSILIYEFTIDIDFTANKESEEVKGSFRVQEFSQDDLDDL